ncbi:protein ABHD11 [Trichonephila inaurata madagascariensis]|uniref:Protein ABHD11 n=1 Tax=Trichonephila inaurata madagascariensis TaxID=2747483 RepID=A0A8X6I6Z4_9ARAC|nr:protein ABHD11 [Trichonephila inaurata madagascariensis]
MNLAYELILPSEGLSENSLSPVIMLHGRMNSKKTWKKFAPEIAERTKRQPEAVEKLIVEDMDTKDYPEFAKQAHLGKINILRESLTAIPPNADEMTARKAVLNFLQEKLNRDPMQPKKSSIYGLEELPIKKEGNSYVWQANLDIVEDTFVKDAFNKKLSGVYNGKSLFLYGKESFFNV